MNSSLSQILPSQSPRRFLLLAGCLGTLAAAISPAEGQRVFPETFSDRQVESMKESVEPLLALSEEDLRARVPVKSGGIWFTDCPNCDFGSQDRGPFQWDPENPDQIQCEGCNAVYPDNQAYPDDEFLEVKAPEGIHRIHYWENPETGYRIFFRAHADYLHLRYLETAARNLGRLYSAIGEDRYARAAAILLSRIAEVVPGYAYTFDFPYREKLFSPYTRNRIPHVPEYRTSLWTRWAYNDISLFLLEAYDHVREWNGWEALGGEAARQTIEKDLFTLLVEFVLGFEDPLTNMSPRIWRGAILAGRLLDRPEWVHESIRRFERMLSQQFLHDGHWYETSPSYHAMTINGMRTVMEAAHGYSDPEGYRHPATGRRFDDLDLTTDIPQYGLAIRALEETRLPNGRLLPVNDTWAGSGKSEGERLSPRDSSESLLMPGMGVAILAAGQGDQQIFSWLNFTSGTAHKQRDTLSIGLFGHGEEVLPDIGYTHTRYRRAWASSMMAHNTVVVDGREPEFDADHAGNRPVAFASNGKDFQLAAAESVSAYPKRTERYRRTLMLLGDSAYGAYLLDVFEINGGSQHDYLLHGSADGDSTADLRGTDLRPFSGSLVNPGAAFSQPVGEHDEMGPEGSFSFIRDLRQGKATQPLRLDYRLKENPRKGSRTLFAELSDANVFLGRSPSIRRAEESDARIDDYWMPTLVLRRKGKNLRTLFVAAHEAVDGHPRLQSIKTRRDGDRLWISVDHANGRDYITVMLGETREASFQTSKGTFSTDATYAAVRLGHNDEIHSSHLVEGKFLQFRNHRLLGPGEFRGTIRRVSGHAAGETVFQLDKNPDVRRPDLLVVEFPDGSHRGYSVTRVEHGILGARVYVREARGFEEKKQEIEITSYPQRVIEGTGLRYRLIDSAHAE